MIDQKLQRLINRFIELNWRRFEDDYDSHAREIHELTNEDFEFRDIIEGIFVYIMDQNEDPTDYFYDNMVSFPFSLEINDADFDYLIRSVVSALKRLRN